MRFFVAAVIGWAMLSSVSFGSGWAAGRDGNSLSFDGVDDYVNVPAYKGILGDQSRTCLGWIKTSGSSVNTVIIEWGDSGILQNWTFGILPTGELELYVGGPSGWDFGHCITTVTLADNQWHHVAAVFDNGDPDDSKEKLYVDGQLQIDIRSFPLSTQASNDVMIGASLISGTPANFFNGLIDDICIYNRALTTNEINPQAPVPTTGLVARWAMDENEGAIVHDAVSSHNGILRNMFGYSGGSGTPEDPYQIDSVFGWLTLMAAPSDWDKHFIMIADVDLQDIPLTPVGDSSTAFIGTFNGNNHVVRNAVINVPCDSVGLFGRSFGQISNLSVVSVNASGCRYVGGLIGTNTGIVNNCSVTSSVVGSCSNCIDSPSCVGGLVGRNSSLYGGMISHCQAICIVSGDYNAGGLVGENNGGIITSCSSDGTVSGQVEVGGLVGTNNQMYSAPIPVIENCYSSSQVQSDFNSQRMGGLIGDNSGIVSYCYATGSVACDPNASNLGGLIGSNKYPAAINYCYATGDVSYGSVSGGLVGSNSGSPIISCYSTGTVIGNRSVGGLVGINRTIQPPSGSIYPAVITACYSSSQVYGVSFTGGLAGDNSEGSISNCYSTGFVSGVDYVGGLVGNIDGGTHYNSSNVGSFWDTETSGQTTSAGGSDVKGKTTEEMKTLSTFTSAGWDFTNETANGIEDVWRMCVDGADYPRLNWESIDGDFSCPDGVSIEDLNYFVGRWLMNNCTSTNNYCGGADMDASGTVQMTDFSIFAQHWLEEI